MLDVTIIIDEPSAVPFADRIKFFGRGGWKHVIITTSLLRIIKRIFPSRVIHHLILRAGLVVVFVLLALHHMINDSAIASGRNFPVETQLKISVRFCRDQRAANVSGAFGKALAVAYDHSLLN